MNLSPISAVTATYNLPEAHKAAPAPQASSSPIEDKVSISPAAQKASGGIDADHDGDSH